MECLVIIGRSLIISSTVLPKLCSHCVYKFSIGICIGVAILYTQKFLWWSTFVLLKLWCNFIIFEELSFQGVAFVLWRYVSIRLCDSVVQGHHPVSQLSRDFWVALEGEILNGSRCPIQTILLLWLLQKMRLQLAMHLEEYPAMHTNHPVAAALNSYILKASIINCTYLQPAFVRDT